MTTMQWLKGMTVSLLLLLALALAFAGPPPAQAQEPPAGGGVRTATFTLVSGTVVSGTTDYSPSPNLVGAGRDASRVADWQTADLFIDADIGSGTLTVTVQFSPDAALWADMDEVVPSWNQTGTVTFNTRTFQSVMTADGTELLRTPVAGEFMRVKIEASAQSTVTVKSTLRSQ